MMEIRVGRCKVIMRMAFQSQGNSVGERMSAYLLELLVAGYVKSV